MPKDPYDFDIALSFAGEDRQHAEKLAGGLREFRVRVFYDLYEQAALWGKDLYQHLQTVYRDRAKYCVIFVSEHYATKVWTKHELRQAQARAIAEKGEYILPLRLDDTELPGLNATIGYIDLRRNDIEAVTQLLLRKVYGDDYQSEKLELLTWRGELVPFRGSEVASFWPKQLRAAQRKKTYRLITEVPRVRFGDDLSFNEADPGHGGSLHCHDCAAIPGEFHVPGCDMERCPKCGGQIISCGCEYDEEFV